MSRDVSTGPLECTVGRHTPGPWTAERKPGRFAWDIRVPGVWIGEVASWCAENPDKQDEAAANARLIAAAPELLEALQHARQQLYYAPRSLCFDVAKIDAVIAKALGVPPNAAFSDPGDKD